MNRDDARKILGDGASEEQVTNLLNQFHNSEKAKNDEIARLNSKLNEMGDYDTIKQKLDDINRANMTKEEEIAEKERIANENYAKSRIMLNTTTAKQILAGLDLDDETISMLVSDDEAKTISNANKLKATFDSMKENVAKKTKEELLNTNLKPTLPNVPQGDSDTMTMEKFMSLSATEQEKFIAEHPQEFENL